MSLPSTSTCPCEGLSRPPRICSSVVLPEPDAPTIDSRSPARIETFTAFSTSSVTGPCWKCLATLRASRTDSVMSQSLGRRGSRRAPSGVDRGEYAEQEGHDADADHVRHLHVGRQLTHVIDARIHELHAEGVLDARNDGLDVECEQDAEARTDHRAGEANQHTLHDEHGEHV